MFTCGECWDRPCTCGAEYKHLSDTKLLLLIHNLIALYNNKHTETKIEDSINGQPIYEYLLEHNRGMEIHGVTYVELMKRTDCSIPDKHMHWLSKYKTIAEAYAALDEFSNVEWKTPLALTLLVSDPQYNPGMLKLFVARCLSMYCTYFFGKAYKPEWENDYEILVTDLYAMTAAYHQMMAIRSTPVDDKTGTNITEAIRPLSPQACLSIKLIEHLLTLLDSQSLERRVAALIEIIRLIATGSTVEFLIDSVANFVDAGQAVTEYGVMELDDCELLKLLKDTYPTPYFGSMTIQ